MSTEPTLGEYGPEEFLATAADGPVDYEPLAYLPAAEAEQLRRVRDAAHELSLDLAGLRRALGLTQMAVAAAAGSTQANISRIEREASSLQLSTLVDYLRALGTHATLHVERDGAVFELELI